MLSLMEGQLHNLVQQKILDSIASPIPVLTRRDIHVPQISGKAIAVIGIRRGGKTSFLWQLIDDCAKEGAAREGMLYFSFEDERLAGITTSDLNLIIEEYYRLYPTWRDKHTTTFMFDEIQVVPGWERFVRRVLDSERAEVFLSGSSAKLLSKEVATSMRGRAMEARIFPFSFREYLRHRDQESVKPPGRWTKSERTSMDHALREYLVIGGFPEAQRASLRDRYELLRGYVDLVLLRDVIERYRVTNPTALRWMVRHLLSAPAGRFTVNKFFSDLKSQGIAVSKDSLHTFFGYLEDAFLIHAIPIAAASVRKRMVNPRKVYPCDMGFIPLFDRTGRANVGHSLETAVLVELLRKGCEPEYVIADDGYEVDFLVRQPDKRNTLIQVVAGIEDTTTQEREVRALLSAVKTHPGAAMHLITLSPESMRNVPDSIVVHSAADWFLQEVEE